MKNNKWLSLCGVAVAGILMMGSAPAMASQIPFAGAVTLNQVGSGASPAVSFAFNGLTVNSLSGDTLNGAAVNLNGGFTLSGPITTNGTESTASFTNPNGTISIGGGATGTFSGNVNFITISTDSTHPGFFSVNMGLTSLTITGGTSAMLNSMAGSTQGIGKLSFNFSSGPQTLADLEGIGTAGSTFDSQVEDSVAGTVAVPEPATLALFGSGLIGLAFVFKRRLFDNASLDLQA